MSMGKEVISKVIFKELCDECMSFGIFEGEERILWCGKHEARLPPYRAERPCERIAMNRYATDSEEAISDGKAKKRKEKEA